jgi:hypothetical protein
MAKGDCKHVFVQGAKKGTECGKGCRGDFCKEHKQSKKQYAANYRQEKREEQEDYPIKQQIEKINLLEDMRELKDLEVKNDIEYKEFKAAKVPLYRVFFGIEARLGVDIEKSDYFILFQRSMYGPYPEEYYKTDIESAKQDILKWKWIRKDRGDLAIPFNGSITSAKEKRKRLEKKISEYNTKIKANRKVKNAIEKRISVLEERRLVNVE